MVEVDIYSGRPNPHWRLDVETAKRLRDAIEALPSATSSEPMPEPLGYRGLVIKSGMKSYRVFDGTVEGDGARFSDPARRVERLILATMPDALRVNFGFLTD